jgi:hypothetical protein
VAQSARADIEVNVKGLKQVQELLASLDKVSARVNNLNKTGKGSKDKANKAEKEAEKIQERKRALLVKNRNIGDQIQRGVEKGLKVEKASSALKRADLAVRRGEFTLAKAHQQVAIKELAIEKQITKENLAQLKAQQNKNKAGVAAAGKRLASAGQGAIISGAFPLLFGQGPLVAGAGAIGGGLGGLAGGPMGSFAGGLAATSAATAIQGISVEVSKLGQALNERTKDVAALTQALGETGTEFGDNIQVLKELGLEEQAFEAARKRMVDLIGNEGVEAVTNFGDDFQKLGNEFAKVMTLMRTSFAKFMEESGIMQFIVGKVERNALLGQAEASGQTGDSEEAKNIKALIERRDNLSPLVSDKERGAPINKELADILGKDKGKGLFGAFNVQDLADARELLNDQIIANQLLINQANEKKDLEKTINDISVGKVNDLKEEFDFKQRLLPMSKEEREIETEIQKIRDIIKQIKGEEATFDEQAIRDQIEKNRELDKELELTQRVEDAFKSLSNSINNDIKEGIKGLIKGTSTLGDMLNNIADKFLDLALNQGLFGSILGSAGKPGGGLLGALKLFGNGGRPPVGKPSIVGEKGPELFVPRSSGMIIPNNKLGGGGSTSVVVNVDASGSDVQGDDAGGQELGSLIAAAVQGEIVKQQRPGGLLNR